MIDPRDVKEALFQFKNGPVIIGAHESQTGKCPEELSKLLESEDNVILFADGKGTVENLLVGFLKESDSLVLTVGFSGLIQGYRQIELNRELGAATVDRISKLGCIPDIIIANCRTRKGIKNLLDWRNAGSKIVLYLENKGLESMVEAEAFKKQVNCKADGTFDIKESKPTILEEVLQRV